MYTVTDGRRSSQTAVRRGDEDHPAKTKVSRSQLEQRSVMHLQNETIANSVAEVAAPVRLVTHRTDQSAVMTRSPSNQEEHGQPIK